MSRRPVAPVLRWQLARKGDRHGDVLVIAPRLAEMRREFRALLAVARAAELIWCGCMTISQTKHAHDCPLGRALARLSRTRSKP